MEKISKGVWIKLVNYNNNYYLLTNGNSYKVEKDLNVNNFQNIFGTNKQLVEVRNDLGDIDRYVLDRFELDTIKTRAEAIDEILF